MSNEFVITGNRSLVGNNKKSTTYTTQNNVTNFMVETNQIYEDLEEPDYGILDAMQDVAANKFERIKNSKETFNNILDFIFTDANKATKTNVWSSFFGSEAKHSRDHISHYLFGRGKGLFKFMGSYDRVGAPNRKDGEAWLKTKFNNWNTAFNNKIPDKLKFTDKEGNKVTGINNGNNYRVGQDWKYGSVSFASKKIFNANGYVGDLYLGAGEKGVTPGYAEVGLLHYGASAEAAFGPDHVVVSGSAEFSLIHAEAGANGTLWDAQILGTDVRMLGADGSVKADVGKAYVKGKVGAGYYKGADGKYHLDAGINGEIGAEACSVEANGSITVAGTDIGVKAKAKIGIGAQFNLGIEDGKAQFHIGAALGIGFELGFSVDMGGTFEVAKEAVTQGLDALENIADGIASDISEGWEDLKNSNVGKAVNNFTSWLFG